MAIFKVGQRVRLREDLTHVEWSVIDRLGKEAVIARVFVVPPAWYCEPGQWYELSTGCYAIEYALEPLTDPRADAFIESIKRLGYTEPKAPVSEPVHEGTPVWGDEK